MASTKQLGVKSIAKPMSPHVASWLGTFVAAGIQLAVHGNADKTGSKNHITQGTRMAILGPSIGLALWKLFSLKEDIHPAIPIFVASFFGTSLLNTQGEAEAVNNVIWLRVASQILSNSNRRVLDLLTHIAIMITFYGIVNHTSIAPGLLVKMTKRFLSPSTFAGVQGKNEGTQTEAKPSLKDSINVFLRTFRGLFAYNYFLHFAAAIVSYVIRAFGSKAVQGARSVKTTIPDVLLQATKEATTLNTAVSASCALLVAGTSIANNSLGVLLMPVPLWFCAPRVRDTVYFLFTPWCTKYLFRLYDIGQVLNPRLRILLGVLLLEGPLRQISKDDSESYSWMIGVAFGLVRTAGAGLI